MKFTVNILAACLLLISVNLAQEDPPNHSFNCLRTGSECFHSDNSTCTEEGKCACEGYMGYDCYYSKDDVSDSSACPSPCENDGVCVAIDGGDPECYCSEAFYGTTCSYNRVSHHCKFDSMIININPNTGAGQFEGKVYVYGHDSEPECIFDPTSEENQQGFSKTVEFSACGGATEVSLDTGDVERSFQVVVQYLDLFMVDSDESYTFKCLVRKTGSEIESEDDLMPEGSQNALDISSLSKGTVSKDLNPVSFQVLGPDNMPLSGPVAIGTPISLVWTLDGGDLYKAFQLLQVRAKNGYSSDDPKYAELPLIQNGCAYKGASPVLVSFDGEPTDQLRVVFKSFVLRNTLRLQISTMLKVCENITECEPLECDETALTGPNFLPGAGRRRRDVSDTTPSFVHSVFDGTGRTQYREYDTTIYVASPGVNDPNVANTGANVQIGYTTTPSGYPGYIDTGYTGNVVYPAQYNPYMRAPSQYYGYRQVVYSDPNSAYYYYNRPSTGYVMGDDVAFYSDGPMHSGWPSYCAKGLILFILTIVFGILFLITLCCCVYYCVKAHDRPLKYNP